MKKAIIIFFILMFTMSPAAFAATKYYQVYTPDEYAENDYIQANEYVVIMLLVDYSSSMVNWINLAKDVLKTVVPEIPSNTKVGLRVFGQGVLVKNTECTYLAPILHPNMPGKSFVNPQNLQFFRDVIIIHQSLPVLIPLKSVILHLLLMR